MCEVRGVILGLGFVGITLISHFPHPTSHFSYKLQFIEMEVFMQDLFNNLDWMQFLRCFVVGGLICIVGQILIDKTKLTPARILVIFVTAGAILRRIRNIPTFS